jgi:hypothetical protein
VHITFESTELWCRHAGGEDGGGLWVRIGVENGGGGTARGCVGRLLTVSTDGRPRRDIAERRRSQCQAFGQNGRRPSAADFERRAKRIVEQTELKPSRKRTH